MSEDINVTDGTVLESLNNKVDLDAGNYHGSGLESVISGELNKKQATVTGGATSILNSNLTPEKALISDATGKVTASSIKSSELDCLSGVKSNVQNQLDNSVHKTGDETINGNKVFNGILQVTTPSTSDNSQKPATTSWVRNVMPTITYWD